MASEEHLPRKLIAILYADVAGYSRLTGEDEEGTHRHLSEYLDLISAAVETHQGRVVHYAGDAVLADFATVTEALNCAWEIQQTLALRNDELPADRRVEFRIGVNLGEVIVDRDDIYGDGVNVAARLESLAEPGGICVSESVRTAAGSKLALGFEFLGKKKVKNITEPIPVYRVTLQPNSRAHRALPTLLMRHKAMVKLAAGAVLLGFAVFLFIQFRDSVDLPGTSPDYTALPKVGTELSLAVLPFDNLTNDPKQDYFSDGITGDLITALSRLSKLLVIARHSVFTFKGEHVDVREVGQRLDARYVLEGSVQRVGDRVRINTQLNDTMTGYQIWAERFDRKVTDVFALQDEIVNKLVAALSVKLTQEERRLLARLYDTSVEAYDLFLRGQVLLYVRTREGNERAREMFQKALELDVEFARAYSALALTHVADYRNRWSPEPEISRNRALALALQAIKMDDTLPEIHWSLGYIYLYKKQHARALKELERAIKLDPNFADAYALMAGIKTYLGRPAETIPLIRTAFRLNPKGGYLYYVILGRAHYFEGQMDEALAALNEATDRNAEFIWSRLYLAAIYVMQDQHDDAEWQATQILTIDPDFNIATWEQSRPFKDPELLADFTSLLRKAGLP